MDEQNNQMNGGVSGGAAESQTGGPAPTGGAAMDDQGGAAAGDQENVAQPDSATDSEDVDGAAETVDQNLVEQDVDPADVHAEDKTDMTQEVTGQ